MASYRFLLAVVFLLISTTGVLLWHSSSEDHVLDERSWSWQQTKANLPDSLRMWLRSGAGDEGRNPVVLFPDVLMAKADQGFRRRQRRTGQEIGSER